MQNPQGPSQRLGAPPGSWTHPGATSHPQRIQHATFFIVTLTQGALVLHFHRRNFAATQRAMKRWLVAMARTHVNVNDQPGPVGILVASSCQRSRHEAEENRLFENVHLFMNVLEPPFLCKLCSLNMLAGGRVSSQG